MCSKSSWVIRKHALAILVLMVAAAALSANAAMAKTLAVVGDSLSSGHGLQAGQSWVARLKQRLADQGYDYEVVNASITGDTSAGGLARLPKVLMQHQPDIVVIELGGNDGLRGQPANTLQSNLARMITLSQDAGAKVLLLGIRIPPNYGPQYTKAIEAVYPALASQFHVPVVRRILQGVALHPNLMQADGIHPNAKGQAIVFDNIWPTLSALLVPPPHKRDK